MYNKLRTAAMLSTGLTLAALVASGYKLGWLGEETARGLSKDQTSAAFAPGEPQQSSVGVRTSTSGEPGPEAFLPPSDSDWGLERAAEVEVPARDLPHILAGASTTERGALEDGILTRQEFNAGVLRAQQCTVDSTRGLPGVSVNDVVENGGRLRFGGFTAPSKQALQQASDAHLACVREHLDDIAAGWSAAAAEPRFQRLWAATAECMRNAGTNPPQGADWQQLLETSISKTGNRMLYNRCSGEAQSQSQ